MVTLLSQSSPSPPGGGLLMWESTAAIANRIQTRMVYNAVDADRYDGLSKEESMHEAEIDGQLVKAGPDCPDVAQCPACGGEVRKRRRKVSRTDYVYFYRHRIGVGNDCPLRYRPTR